MSCCIWCIFLMLGVGSFLHVRHVQMRKKLWRKLLDATKYTEVGLSYMCNNISTLAATQLYIRLRWDLLLAARFLHVQQGLTKTPRQQKNINQMTWATLCSTQFNPPNIKYHPMTKEQWDVCVVWRCGLAASCQCECPCCNKLLTPPMCAHLCGNVGARKQSQQLLTFLSITLY